jgi:aminoglycoside 3-N-acetyltransferase
MTDKSSNTGVEVYEAEVSEVWVSKDELVTDLRKMGVREGDDLGVALSLRCVGHVVGGPDAFIDALLEAVGPEGMIMMNTHTPFFHISQIESSDPKYIFDYRSTPTWTGIVPETLRKREGAIRSLHPICSVAAIGARADYLTEGHDVSSRPYVPYSRLAKVGGKVLYIGLNGRMVAMRHEAQNLAGLMDVVPLEIAIRYIDPDDGVTKLFRAANVYACVKNLPALVPALREKGLITDGKIGAADSILVSAKDALEATTEMLREDPTLTLCKDVSCIWCREMERRMDLYDRIEDPEIFQINRVVIGILGVINERRLRGSWAAIRAIGLLKKIL